MVHFSISVVGGFSTGSELIESDIVSTYHLICCLLIILPHVMLQMQCEAINEVFLSACEKRNECFA